MKRIFGFIFFTLGLLLILFALWMGVGSTVADQEAGKQNEAEWKEYNEWVAQVDTITDEAVVDSLMDTRKAPPIRQGGFATAFGIVFAIIILIPGILFTVIGYHLKKRPKPKEIRKE